MTYSEETIALIAKSALFDESWYLETYPDVSMTRISAAEHYLRFGGPMGRDPGPDFCSGQYLGMYPDVKEAGMNPLLHFEQFGHDEGRLAQRLPSTELAVDCLPPSRLCLPPRFFPSTKEAGQAINAMLALKLGGKPIKLFREFDTALEDELLAAAATFYRDDPGTVENIKVSVVMPAYNRGDRIGKAIRSVQSQSHGNFELLIVDDGSTDNTREVLKEFAGDDRVRVFWNDHLGVSAARNTGLENASGQFIFYLDSDNVWMPDFLAVMVVAFRVSGSTCIYGASKIQNSRKEVLGYRGEPFNWDQCLSDNYVDMNVFGHRAELVAQHGPFDTKLERMVDWDLILRYTRTSGAAYCPVLGCIYFEDSKDTGRITTSKPYIFRKIVHEKNRLGLATATETFDKLSLRFALKIPVLHKVRHAWGDFHYAESLKAAFEALGHAMRIDFLEDWEKHPHDSADVTIVLHGLSHYDPKPSEFGILWNINHPDQVSYEEYAKYKIVFVASASYAALLSNILGREVFTLLPVAQAEHNFDRRAQQVVECVGNVLLARKPADMAGRAPAAIGAKHRKRVGLLLQPGRNWPTSSAFIRLIAPLTTDYACTKLEILQLDNVGDPRLQDCDICIVQRIAVQHENAAQTLLERLVRLGIPLFVDTDDAFFLHEAHKGHDLVLQKLMQHAQETWFSTPKLQDLYKDVPGQKRVLRNNLDPRFWRDYRKPVNTRFDAPHVRFVYMGTASHDTDFLEVLPAFERLGQEMPGMFDLTLIGAVRNPPKRPWLKALPPPVEKGSYPDFVRWLMQTAQFDVGIAPLADSAFNHAKSDIKVLDYSALGLLPLVSDCPAYAKAIAAGLAVGCGHGTGDWHGKAADIINNPGNYEPMRAHALEHVWKNRNTLDASPALVDLLQLGPLMPHNGPKRQ